MRIGKRTQREVIVIAKECCDFCGAEIPWNVQGRRMWFESYVDRERGEDESYIDYQSSNDRTEYTQYLIDICQDCFLNKIKPMIEQMGVTFRTQEYGDKEFDKIEES
jgi:hypothetical protein